MKRHGRFSRRLRAFTLVELIVAMTVAAISLAVATDLFRSVRDSYDRQETKMQDQQEVFEGLSELYSDLTQAIINWPQTQSDFLATGTSDNTLVSYLEFTTLAPSVDLDGSLGVSRPHRVSYQIEGDVGSGEGRLIRRATPLLGKNKLSGLTTQKILARKVKSFVLIYWDSEDQHASWSSKGLLPRKVGVLLSTTDGNWSLSIIPQASIGQVEEEQTNEGE